MSDHLWMLRQEAIERLEAAWLHRLLKQPELLTEEGEAGVVDATVIGHVSVIPVHGVIAKGWRGDVSPLAIENAVNWSLGNPNVRAIVLDIDSPGGGVTGLTEAASTIFAAREQKPIVAVAAHQATSAALWLGSAAGELVVSPSGEIGSIGVYLARLDVTKFLEDMGIKMHIIKAGAQKAFGHPALAFTETEQAVLQAEINGLYDEFIATVATHRKVTSEHVRKHWADARIFRGPAAVSNGLADRVATLDQTVSQLNARVAGAGMQQGMRNDRQGKLVRRTIRHQRSGG